MNLFRTAVLLLSLSVCTALHAQRQICADVQTKTVRDGKVSTVTSSVYCTNNGRLVTCYHTPAEYIVVTNRLGEARMYMPSANEVFTPQAGSEFSSRDELLSVFMSGRMDDLGLSLYGYRPVSSGKTEEGYIKRDFAADVTPSDGAATLVSIVYDNYLPIYCEYQAGSGKVVRRVYYSHYFTGGRGVTLPLRMTSIEYGQGRDSTVVRTIYSNLRIDEPDPMFDFEIPSDARPVSLTRGKSGVK